MALIEHFLRQDAEIKPFVCEANGDLVYGPIEFRACRLETGLDISIGKGSPGVVEQVQASAMMFTIGDPIPDRSIVTVDDRKYTVIRCRVMQGFHYDHLEVYLE